MSRNFNSLNTSMIDCGLQYFSSRDTVEMPLFGKKKSAPSEFYRDSLMCVYNKV